MEIDIRNVGNGKIDTIRFAEERGEVLGIDCPLAYVLVLKGRGVVGIHDPYARVVIKDKQHALNLIKALNKAIELEWLRQ